jgi:hypothetical protein
VTCKRIQNPYKYQLIFENIVINCLFMKFYGLFCQLINWCTFMISSPYT